jgi:hypothetical protein
LRLHYDYIRQPGNDYSPARFQVEGNSPDLDELFGRVGRSGRLGELRFPVSGKRFRPSLAEIVEFLPIARRRFGSNQESDTA